MSKRDIIVFAVLINVALVSCRKSDYRESDNLNVISDQGAGTGTVTLKSTNQYLLDGLVFVNDGQVLTIEPGTVIRGKTGQGEKASALVVARGGRIIAEGTPLHPIIFTSEGDDLDGSVPLLANGLWGGVVILGKASLNTQDGESHVEGIPFSESRGIFGGTDDEDGSGIFRYVSIRHAGTDIGEGNEINGLTLGGVGSNTVIDHIEVVSARDDGVEFFGGTVSIRYLTVAFCEDDAVDYDLGFRGKGQFWLLIQDPAVGGLCFEGSGGVDPETGQPYSIPVFANITAIGRGPNITNKLILFDRNAGGKFMNSIFIDQGDGVAIEYRNDVHSCYTQFLEGNLTLTSNLFFNVAGNTETEIFRVFSFQGSDLTEQNSVISDYFENASNFISDPGILSGDMIYHVIPLNNIHYDLEDITDPWFEEVLYRGAFNDLLWLSNWTLLHKEGIIH